VTTERSGGAIESGVCESREQSASLESEVLALLRATEALAERVLAGEEGEPLSLAMARRDDAFDAFQARVASGGKLDAATRAVVLRVGELDEAIIGAGRSLIGALHGERLDLLRRRSAIQAHAARERGEARLVTVKA